LKKSNTSSWLGTSKLALEGCRGFVYLIYDLTDDKIYIGKKKMHSVTKVKVKLKDGSGWSKKKKVTTKENDWRNYYGSSKELSAAVRRRGKECFMRFILQAFTDLRDLSYAESDLLFHFRVLSSKKYYNKAISVTAMHAPEDQDYLISAGKALAYAEKRKIHG